MTRRAALGRYLQAHPTLADSLLAIALFLLSAGLTGSLPREAWPQNPTAALIWSGTAMATVALRRRWLWPAIGLVTAHAVVAALVHAPTDNLALVVLTYTAAAHLPVRRATVAVVLMWVPATALVAMLGRYEEVMELNLLTYLLFTAMTAVLAYLAGRMVFTRRRYVAALVERARAAEQNQQALAEQAVEEERRRIARELHDMVAHHVSVMGVLATGSRRMLHKDPAAADEALTTIENTSRTVLREMRRLLDVLRTDPEPVDPLAPQPGLAGLAALVEQVREAGLEVNLRTGAERPTDPAVALTVYRIVQEALTNVLKHGGARATAEVRLDYEPDCLTLEIYDTGRGPQIAVAEGVGHGLLGMRERVALFGGTLRTGPRPGGGFRVYARIPLEATP